ncbi:hypothetical protein RV134_270176 [Roseovarius sp. EC-HK134]|nr:hypothetical protein RV420_310032 [Roseovarius sp. EC-SD190]VVT14698.1 hypothetical protein RV134_270176 [Roseovarius sp. EC-HK134]
MQYWKHWEKRWIHGFVIATVPGAFWN